MKSHNDIFETFETMTPEEVKELKKAEEATGKKIRPLRTIIKKNNTLRLKAGNKFTIYVPEMMSDEEWDKQWKKRTGRSFSDDFDWI